MPPAGTWFRRDVLSLLSVGASLFAGCSTPIGRTTAPGGNNYTPTWEAPVEAPKGDVEVNRLVERLEIPWDVSVGPDGDVFVSERVGRINRYAAGRLQDVLTIRDAIDAEAVPPSQDEQQWWVKGGEGGTLGLALHSGYPDERSLYVYYTATVEEDEVNQPATGVEGKVNRVSRFDVSADNPAETEQVLIDNIPAFKVHNGGRIEFGPKGYLWVTTGSAAFDKDDDSNRAANPGSLAGKVLRVTADGTPAPENPDLGKAADPRVYSYGFRNPQGIAWLPDGTTIVTDHGGEGNDEINRLEAGANYGWPNAPRERDKYVNNDNIHPPLANTGNDTWAPSGCVFYNGEKVPSWSNRLLVGGLRSQAIIVVTVTPPGDYLPPVWFDGTRFIADWYDDAYAITAHSVLKDELGRVRHIEQGPEGELYAITSNRDGRATGRFPRERDDLLVRLEAA